MLAKLSGGPKLTYPCRRRESCRSDCFPNDRVHEIPDDLASLRHLEHMADVARGDEQIAVGKQLGGALTVGEEARLIPGLVFPFDLVGLRIDDKDPRTGPFRIFGAVVEDRHLAVSEPAGVMRTEHLLIARIEVGRAFPGAVGAGVAPAVLDLAGLVVDQIELGEVAGVHQDLIGLRDVLDGY